MAILKNTTINDTGFLQLPVGTTAQRPAPTNGKLRFNSNTGKLEFYNAVINAWIGTPEIGIVAAGGLVYDVDTEGTTYRVHVFTTTGNSTFTVTKGGQVEYLIVAGGGGGGGGRHGAGGGAGGVLTGFINVTPQSYTITVGTGGNGGPITVPTRGISGANSLAFGLTSIGGGGGGSSSPSEGLSGGSGGGTARSNTFALGAVGQGNNGGTGNSELNGQGAGGGGAGSTGGPAIANLPAGSGGIGLVSLISGIPTFYAGGGGGGGAPYRTNGLPGLGGVGGGGNGNNFSIPGQNGTPNTGGGGGGQGGSVTSPDINGAVGGTGGSGIVIIRYPLRQENPTINIPKIAGDGLVLDLDFSKPTATSFIPNALFYRWWSYSSSLGNPTTKSTFDSLFNLSVTGSGIDIGRTINWPDLTTKPAYITQNEYFAWEVSGYLIAPVDGTYSFSTRSDDGNELKINDTIVTSFYGGRGVPAAPGDTGSISLNAGRHRFVYRMQQGGGGAGAIVSWIVPGTGSYVIIPSTNFQIMQQNDSRLNGITGTAINSPVFTDERTHRSSFRFNGTDTSIDCGNSNSVNFGTGNFTVSVWFRRFSSATTNERLLSKAAESDTANAASAGFCFFGSNNGISFAVNPTAARTIINAGSYSVNEWVNVVGLLERGVSMRTYKNAVQVATATAPTGSVSGTSPFTLGSNINGSPRWTGEISIVNLYNRALTNQEILDNYNATRWRFGI